jgi:hypothetical protein
VVEIAGFFSTKEVGGAKDEVGKAFTDGACCLPIRDAIFDVSRGAVGVLFTTGG